MEARNCLAFVMCAAPCRLHAFDHRHTYRPYNSLCPLMQILATINDISAWWHVFGTIFVVICLPAVATSKQPASYVFTGFANESDTTGVYNPGKRKLAAVTLAETSVRTFAIL